MTTVSQAINKMLKKNQNGFIVPTCYSVTIKTKFDTMAENQYEVRDGKVMKHVRQYGPNVASGAVKTEVLN